MVALALAAILLTVLFRYLAENTRFQQAIAKTSSLLLQRQRLSEKIDSILTNLEPGKSDRPGFYTFLSPDKKSESLAALFNAGIDPDPAFSGTCSAMLHLNQNQEFCFTWISLSEEKERTEILLPDVRRIQWEFLGQQGKKEDRVIAGTWSWLKQWPKDRSGAPKNIRISFWCGIDPKKEKDANLKLAFILPAQEPMVIE